MGKKHIKRKPSPLFDARMSLQKAYANVTALEELAQHLRHCRECGETDVMHCWNGQQLWLVCFPSDAGVARD